MLKIGIYILFYFGFLALIIIGIGIRKEKKTTLLNKDESNYLKGVAALMVFLAHSQSFLALNDQSDFLLKPFSALGGVGVLLFFFLSGYGIYKGYSEKNPSIKFWKNRILRVLIPALIISISFSLVIELINDDKLKFSRLIIDSLSTQWYVDVVMIEYLVFFITWYLVFKSKRILLILSFLGSALVGFVFWKLGFNPRWYNGLMLFPTGMLFGFIEPQIVSSGKSIRIIVMFFSLLAFAGTGLGFSVIKGNLFADFLKTFSGILLATFFVMLISFLKVGNKAIYWVGERSLYIYLVHLNLLNIFKITIAKGLFSKKPELYIFILLLGTLIITEGIYFLMTKGLKRKKN